MSMEGASQHEPEEIHPCSVTGRMTREMDLMPVSALRPSLADFLYKEYPQLSEDSLVSNEAVNEARVDYVRGMLETQYGELTQLEEEVVESMQRHELLAANLHEEEEEEKEKIPIGDRIADKVASFGGSWKFIISFGVVLLVWIVLNSLILRGRAVFDPHPFILLNLILSCIAALQAPVIMMSQNRLEARDRQHAENDYQINLKAELEIRHLHEKVDYLLKQNSQRMLEVQQIQLDLMREIAQRRRG